VWQPFRPRDGAWHRWRLNGAAAYARRDGGSWRAAFAQIPFRERTGDFGGPEECGPPPEGSGIVHSWEGGETLLLRPCLGPQPYALRPLERLRIPPGRHCRLSVSLPPLLRLELPQGKILAEGMPFLTSRAFFGPDLMRGEIGHSLELAVGQAREGEPAPSALVRCEVLIRNGTKAPIEPALIAIHPEPLSVYERGGALVSDLLELDFTDGDCRERPRRAGGPGCRLVSAGARQSAGESLARRGAGIIKDIAAI